MRSDERLSLTCSIRVPCGRNDGELVQLVFCYRRCLEIAAANGIATIAFPSISTGIYGYPIELAANVAIDSVHTTMANLSSVREVTVCCFSPNDLVVYHTVPLPVPLLGLTIYLSTPNFRL
jgi:O-acetyl-ADP-ribose deacetylase (regulator of RNase III)